MILSDTCVSRREWASAPAISIRPGVVIPAATPSGPWPGAATADRQTALVALTGSTTSLLARPLATETCTAVRRGVRTARGTARRGAHRERSARRPPRRPASTRTARSPGAAAEGVGVARRHEEGVDAVGGHVAVAVDVADATTGVPAAMPSSRTMPKDSPRSAGAQNTRAPGRRRNFSSSSMRPSHSMRWSSPCRARSSPVSGPSPATQSRTSAGSRPWPRGGRRGPCGARGDRRRRSSGPRSATARPWRRRRPRCR